MLDLQKRIQEDYYDTLMKRIKQRQVSVKLLNISILILYFPVVNIIIVILIHFVSLLLF